MCEPDPILTDTKCNDNDDFEFWEEVKPGERYPWQGAIIACVIVIVVVIFGVLPWAWGAIDILMRLIK